MADLTTAGAGMVRQKDLSSPRDTTVSDCSPPGLAPTWLATLSGRVGGIMDELEEFSDFHENEGEGFLEGLRETSGMAPTGFATGAATFSSTVSLTCSKIQVSNIFTTLTEIR